MSRYGSSVSTTQAESQQEKARPSRGIAGWPIRRKLASLVAIPLVVIVASGTYIAAENYLALQQAQHNKSVSEVIGFTNQALTDIQAEVLAVIPTQDGGTQGKTNLQKLRSNSDTSITALLAKLAGIPAS